MDYFESRPDIMFEDDAAERISSPLMYIVPNIFVTMADGTKPGIFERGMLLTDGLVFVASVYLVEESIDVEKPKPSFTVRDIDPLLYDGLTTTGPSLLAWSKNRGIHLLVSLAISNS